MRKRLKKAMAIMGLIKLKKLRPISRKELEQEAKIDQLNFINLVIRVTKERKKKKHNFELIIS